MAGVAGRGGDPAVAGLAAWVRFLDAAGVDLNLSAAPRPWSAPPSVAAAVAEPTRSQPASPARVAAASADARRLAAAAPDMAALLATLAAYDACPLARTAMNLCVGDGDPTSPLMLVGEAPGAEEDRQGRPFVGPSGRLLDQMLAAAGRPRAQTWITNTVFWRPPGNRSPTAQELAHCLPFVERQIELIRPRLLLFVGGTAVRALLDLKDGVTRLRGRRLRYPLPDGTTVPAMVMLHPAYLLRRPQAKALAWRDLLAAMAMLEAA